MSKEKDNIKDLFSSLLEMSETDKTSKDDRLYIPVSPKEFLNSTYYSGFEKDEIYQFWIDEAVDFIEGGYNEVIITGSLGSGKTTFGNLVFAYKIYDLFSYVSVNKYLMLPTIQAIYNIYFSITIRQAARTGFQQFRSIIDNSLWYKENAPRNKNIDSILEFRDGKFSVFSGSSHSHAIGMTVWAFVLDEADFFNKGGSGFDEGYEHITNMYQELVDRRISRFKKYGKDFSFSILVSSASYQSSFVDRRIEAAATDPSIKVIKAVSYNIKPEGTYAKEKFIVFKGHETIDPEIVEENESYFTLTSMLKKPWKADPKLTTEQNYYQLPPSVKEFFEPVPVDFKLTYEKNLYKSLMNHSGVYTARIGQLFQSKSIFLNAYTDSLQHLFTKDEIEISSGDDVQLKDYFLSHLVEHREKPHAMHIDLSVSGDSCGVSLARFDGIVKKENIQERHYSQIITIKLKPPSPPYQLKLSKVRDFVIFLSKDIGINIQMVSFDMYQSIDSMQLLEDEGIKTKRFSIDKSDDPFLIWISLLVDGCVHHYNYKPLQEEAFTLIHDRRKKKVIKSHGGSDDISQSWVGALANLVQLGDLIDSSDYETILPTKAKKEGLVPNAGVYTEKPFQHIVKKRGRNSAMDAILDL